MKKIIFLIVVGIAVFMGGQNYFKKRLAGDTTNTSIVLHDNSEVNNVANVNVRCLPDSEINKITGKSYTLSAEVYTAAVTLLECTYKDSNSIANVTPTIRYRMQLPNNPQILLNKQRTNLQGKPSFKESAQYPDLFASINQVREIDQGTFYGVKGDRYMEFTYTPVSEGHDLLFDRGMSMTQKALNY